MQPGEFEVVQPETEKPEYCEHPRIYRYDPGYQRDGYDGFCTRCLKDVKVKSAESWD